MFKLSKGYEILRKRTIEVVLSNTSNNNEVDETSTSRFLYRVIDVLFAMALDTKSKKQSLVISNRDAVDIILFLACSCTPSSCSEGRARISRVCMTALQDMLSLSAANLVRSSLVSVYQRSLEKSVASVLGKVKTLSYAIDLHLKLDCDENQRSSNNTGTSLEFERHGTSSRDTNELGHYLECTSR